MAPDDGSDALVGGRRAPFVLLTAVVGASLLWLVVALGPPPLVPVFVLVAFIVAVVPDLLDTLPGA